MRRLLAIGTHFALERLRARQHVVAAPDEEKDVIDIMLTLMGYAHARRSFVRDGAVADMKHLSLVLSSLLMKRDSQVRAGLSGFIISLYEHREHIPAEVLLSFDLDENENTLFRNI